MLKPLLFALTFPLLLNCSSDLPSEIDIETSRSLQLSTELPEEEVFGRVFKFGDHATIADGPLRYA